MQTTEQTRIEVAGIVFSILSSLEGLAVQFKEVYQAFLSGAQPAISVYAQYGALPRLSLRDRDLVFGSGGLWSLYKADGRYVVVLRSPMSDQDPYRIALFDEEFRRGEVYSRLPETGGVAADRLPAPLDYPLVEVLMVCLLARGQGLMMHACGIEDGGRGFLFAGNSGHGKTTTARLWRDRATVLNDDRIVLRQREGRFWMYGTPWHGDYTGVSPRGVPLERVFFLRHADGNQAQRVEGVAAASMLLTRCFPPLWDADGMRFTLDFVSQLVEAVPCYELGFVPDERAVEYVRCVP